MLLIVSSCLFVIPMSLFLRRRRPKHASLFGVLTTTSIMYHGKICFHCIKYIDVPLAHAMMIGYTWDGIRKWSQTYNMSYVVGCVMSTLGTLFYIANARFIKKDCLHSLVHVSGVVSIIQYIKASQYNDI